MGPRRALTNTGRTGGGGFAGGGSSPGWVWLVGVGLGGHAYIDDFAYFRSSGGIPFLLFGHADNGTRQNDTLSKIGQRAKCDVLCIWPLAHGSACAKPP